MKRGAVMRVAMSALALLAVADLASAQRGEAMRKPTPTYEADDAAGDPAVWMQRLVGRFRLDGSIIHTEYVLDLSRLRDTPLDSPYNKGTLDPWTQAVQGKADCMHVGPGGGLQCVLNVVWPEQQRSNWKDQLGGGPELTPGVVLAGVAPSTAPGKIRILLVDQRGLAHPGAITLRGDTASAEPPCVNEPGKQECKQIFTITAKNDLIFVTLSTTVRSIRNKLERKERLENVIPGNEISPLERATEKVEERIVVSFSLRRELQQK